MPSTGIRSPGRTITRSPTATWCAGISTSWPSRRTRAVRGVCSTSRPMARRGARKCPRFEDLAQERDEDDLGRDERLPQDQGRQASLRQGQIGPDPALQERPSAP